MKLQTAALAIVLLLSAALPSASSAVHFASSNSSRRGFSAQENIAASTFRPAPPVLPQPGASFAGLGRAASSASKAGKFLWLLASLVGSAVVFVLRRLHRRSRPGRNRDLPLGARPGGIIRIQRAPFTRAQAAGSLVNAPRENGECIVAITQQQFKGDRSLCRYYTATGDMDGPERFLQVFRDERDIMQVMYCTELDRFTVQAADHDAYTGAVDSGLLGDRYHTLSRDDLAHMDLYETQLERVLGARNRLDYQRSPAGAEVFLPPFHGKEVRIDDARGGALTQEICVMRYERALRDGGSESLLISAEMIQRVNGGRDIVVHRAIGIPLEPAQVVIR